MASEVCSMIHDLHLGDHSVGASEGDDALKTACGDSSKGGMTEESSQKIVTEEDIADEEFDDDLVNKHVVTEEEIADGDSDDEFWDKYWEDYCVKRCNPTREEIVEIMTAEFSRIRCIKAQEMALKDGFELSPMYDIELENIGLRSMDEAEFDELLHTHYARNCNRRRCSTNDRKKFIV